MSRRDDIRNRLAAHLLEEQGCAVVCPDKDSMTAFPVTGHLFGWYPPMPIEDDPNVLLVAFSPELIAELTSHLTDEQLDSYLRVVETILDGYIEAIETGVPAAIARERIESALFDTDPDALTLLSEIEARALDTGIVLAGPFTSPNQED